MNSKNIDSSQREKTTTKNTTDKISKSVKKNKVSNKPQKDTLDLINTLNIDQVFINLKIFSKIKKHDKLCFSGNSLEIDNRYAAFFRRWFSSDDRSKSIDYINAIIKRVFAIVDETYSNEKTKESKTINNQSSPFKEENSNLLQRFSIELTNTMTGLDNLKKTYDDDSLIKSNLDLIMDKIKIRIDKINKLLKIHI
jgi:hypothetical protein